MVVTIGLMYTDHFFPFGSVYFKILLTYANNSNNFTEAHHKVKNSLFKYTTQ